VTVVADDGSQETYTIVGSTETRVLEGRISNESPVGRALMGRKAGDKTTVKAPRGDILYTVSAIS
jgi:transcription elongation factor GreA